MKILLTGASGFIGSHLLTALAARYGADNILVVTSKPGDTGYATISVDYEQFCFPDDIEQTLKEVEVVVHAGAFTPKAGQQVNDIPGAHSNIAFTQSLLNLPLPNLHHLIYLSTIDVYKIEGVMTEHSLTEPSSLYGWSKLFCEKLLQTFAQQTDLALNIFRIGHSYGPGEEKYAKFIPQAIRSVVRGQPVEIWGAGTEQRNFIFVQDIVSVILRAVEYRQAGGVTNVVGGRATSIRDIVTLLGEATGSDIPTVQRNVATQVQDVLFDNRLLCEKFLKQETEMSAGLAAEIEYMRCQNR